MGKCCRPLNEQEIQTCKEKFSEIPRAMLVLGATYGLRLSETLQLKFTDFAGSELFIKSKKGSERVSLPVTSQVKETIEALRKYYANLKVALRKDSHLFLGKKSYLTGKSISRIQAYRIMEDELLKVGIDYKTEKVSFHSFRKVFANKIFKATNYNLLETSKYTRHKNISNTQYYLEKSKGFELIKGMEV
ncbi:MAG: tyrosine-type recombinase/integrase [Candidatus Riflebacteria bacterium]|nr:tyrosine-type recombinase/integrase [Candidatus Riflebacteria bacterium]